MSPESYRDCTFREILCIIHGYRKRVQDQARVTWEQARIISYHALVAHVKPGSIKSPKDLIKFAWDDDDVDNKNNFVTDMSQEEKAEYFRVWGLKQKIKHEQKQERKNNKVRNGKPG